MTYDHHDEYSDDVERKLTDIRTKVEEGVTYVWDTFDQAVGSKDWFWLVSPAGKIAFELARGNIEDEIERLWDEFQTLIDDTWEKVSEFTGDPWRLMEMSSAYTDAAGRIRDEKIVINRIGNEIDEHWDGEAFESYTNAVEEQVNAIVGVDGGLKEAAKACAEGAKQIRSIWRDFIDFMLDVVNAILDAIKDGTDAGQWVTFDAGPAIKVIGKCITATLGLWNTMDRYFDDNATVNTAMWDGLNSGLDGLDNKNNWPTIPASELSDMDDQGNWQVA